LLKDTTTSQSAPLTEASQSFEQWLLAVGKSVKTAKNYRKAVEGSISQWAKDAGFILSPFSYSLYANQFESLNQKIHELDSFQANNQLGKK